MVYAINNLCEQAELLNELFFLRSRRKLLNKYSIFVIDKCHGGSILNNNYMIGHNVIFCNAYGFFNSITNIIFSNIVSYGFLKICYHDWSADTLFFGVCGFGGLCIYCKNCHK